MGLFLKQSTSVTLKIGPFLDNTDGDTEETGALAAADVFISKNGAAFANKNEGTAPAHDADGMYACLLDGTDTNTLGRLQLYVHKSGTALYVYHEFMVVTANFYDTICGTDLFQSDLTQMGGVAQSATDLKDFADTGYDPTSHKVQGLVLCDTTTTNTDLTAFAGNYTAARAGYLDNINNAQLLNISAAILGRIDAAISTRSTFNPAADTVANVTTTANLTTNNDKTGYRLSATGVDDVLDEVIEGASPTLRGAVRLFLSALASKVSGVGTGTEKFRDFNDTKDRITATIDVNNNRTAVATDAT